jgi:hypothetical protein
MGNVEDDKDEGEKYKEVDHEGQNIGWRSG